MATKSNEKIHKPANSVGSDAGCPLRQNATIIMIFKLAATVEVKCNNNNNNKGSTTMA